MKYSAIFCSIILFVTGCKKTDEAKTASSAQQVIDSPIRVHPGPSIQDAINMDRSKMKTPEEAIDVLMHLPPGGPIPPHFLPAKDIAFSSKTDSTATYTFTSGTTNLKSKIVLKKIKFDGQPVWDFLRVEPVQ